MNDVLLTNIFFTITALAVIVITIGILLVLRHVIPIARDVRDIVRRLRDAGEKVEKDFDDLRTNLREEGAKGKMLADIAVNFVARKLAPRRKKPKQEEENITE